MGAGRGVRRRADDGAGRSAVATRRAPGARRLGGASRARATARRRAVRSRAAHRASRCRSPPATGSCCGRRPGVRPSPGAIVLDVEPTRRAVDAPARLALAARRTHPRRAPVGTRRRHRGRRRHRSARRGRAARRARWPRAGRRSSADGPSRPTRLTRAARAGGSPHRRVPRAPPDRARHRPGRARVDDSTSTGRGCAPRSPTSRASSSTATRCALREHGSAVDRRSDRAPISRRARCRAVLAPVAGRARHRARCRARPAARRRDRVARRLLLLRRRARRGACTRQRARCSTRETLKLSDIRDLLGSTRKFVVPIMARLDSEGITRRRGDDRIAGPAAERYSSGG